MNVMLLAAGEGTRLRPHTEHTPKPAIPFLSVPMGCYSLSLLDGIQVNNLVINTFHLPQKIEELFWKANFKCNKMLFSHEPTLLDSAGGIHQAENLLKGKGNFLVMNGDEVILPHQMAVIRDLVSQHDFNRGLATILTIKHPEVGHKFGGIWVDPKTNKVDQIAKKKPNDNVEGFHYVGVMVLSDRIFNHFKNPLQAENIFYDTINSAIQKGEEVFHYNIDAEWFETGIEDDFLKATELLLAKLEQLNFKDEALLSNAHSPAQDYWMDYLLQTIRIYGGVEAIVEKSNSSLQERLQRIIQKIRS